MANLHVNLAFSADTGKAKAQIQELLTLLSKITYTSTTSNNLTGTMQEDLQKASSAAKELLFHLNNAFNTTTGKFDLSLLDKSLKTSGTNISNLSTLLLGAGATGQQAFMKLALSISLADLPMLRISKRMQEFAVTMKNTVKWQLSSSMLHGFMGAILSAYGYALDLNKSLTDIRIVTGYSADLMAIFAELANKAAKSLSTTTTDYTNASLIYFQLGLTDAEVAERTEVTVKMANAAGESALIVSDLLTAVWNNFYDGSKSLEYYADVMTALGAATASSTDEISEGLSKFAAVAETVGLSYEYATAALTTITSNTRESADVVGNALKTLFARIQGLKLGETLEDGVDLNKYSEALDKAGISIFESNGELKAMDTILTELADRWDTMSSTLQVALALTVAGVRLYTQLIALMENWDNGDADSMMANLKTIEGAGGALDKQAEIYAQSWEAASKRVQAAAEGIYQSLLDDDFFISIANGFANLLGGLDAFIDGAGGVKTVLTGLAGIALSTFAHLIPDALDTFKYNLEFITKGSQAAYKRIQEDMNKATTDAFNKYNATAGLQGISRDSAMGYAIELANELTAARNKLAMVSDKMSIAEKQSADILLGLILALQEEVVALKLKNEELLESIRLQLESIRRSLTSDNTRGKTLKSSEDMSLMYLSYNDTLIELEEQRNNLIQTINERTVLGRDTTRQEDNLTRINAEIELYEALTYAAVGFANNYKDAIQGLGLMNNRIGRELFDIFTADNFDTASSHVINFAQEFEIAFDLIEETLTNPNLDFSDSLNLKTVKDLVKALLSAIPEAILSATGLDTAFNRVATAMDANELEQAFLALKLSINNCTLEGTDFLRVLESLYGKSITLIATDMLKLSQNTDLANLKAETLKKLFDEFNPTHTVRMSEAMGSLAGLMGNVVTISSSLISMFKSLADPDLSGWEKFSAVLTGLSVIIPTVISSLLAAATVNSFLTATYGKSATVILADTVAKVSNATATKILAIANTGLMASFAPLLVVILAVAAAVAALAIVIGIIIAAFKAWKASTPEGKLEAAKKATEAMADAAKEAEDAYQGLLNTINSYDSAVGALDGLTLGTTEFTNKLIEANNYAQELIDKYNLMPDDYFVNDQGLIEFKPEVLNDKTAEYQEKTESTQAALMAAKNNQTLRELDVLANENTAGLTADAFKKTYEDIIAEAGTLTGFEEMNLQRQLDILALSRFGSNFDELGPQLKGIIQNALKTVEGNAYDTYDEAYRNALALRESSIKTGVINALSNEEEYQASDYKNLIVEEAVAQYLEAYNTALANVKLMSVTELQDAFVDILPEGYTRVGKTIYDAEGNVSEEYTNMTDNERAMMVATAQASEAIELSGIELVNSISSITDSLTEEEKEVADALLNGDLSGLTEDLINQMSKMSVEEITAAYPFIALLEALGIDVNTLLNLLTINLDNWEPPQFNLDSWKKDYAAKMNIINNLEAGDEISAEDYALLGEEYQLYFLVQADGTAILIAKAEELRAAVQEIEIGELEEDIRTKQNTVNTMNEANIVTKSGRELDFNVAHNAATQGTLHETWDEAYINAVNEALETTYETSQLAAEGYNNYINSLNLSLNTLASTAEDLDQLNEMLSTGKINQDEYDANFEGTLAKDAIKYDLDYEEVLDYAENLRELNKELADNELLSKEIALAEKKLAKGADDLIDNYKDYVKVLKKAKLDNTIKDTEKYSKTIKSLQKDLSLLTGYSKEIFTDEFINSNEVLKALLDISNGIDGATERLKVLAAAQEIKIKTGIEVDLATLDALLTEITNLNNQDIEIGAIIDEAPALDALANLLQQAGWTTSLIQEFFNNLGWLPEIGYEEVLVKDLSTHASNGYVEVVEGNPYEGYTVVSKPVSAFSGMNLEEWVKIPKIGSKSSGGGGYKKVDPIGNSSSKTPSSGGGGGGGSKPKHAEKKNDSDKTRYHTLQNLLEDLTAEYEALADASDRAFGLEKLDNIDKEIAKTDELIAKLEEYLDAIATDLPIDKSVMSTYYTDLIGGKIKFDEKGNISNYDEIQDAMFAKYNAMAKAYDEESTEWQVFEKKYELLEKYIELYEETYDLLRNEEDEYQDLLNQKIDLELEKVTYSVEIALDIPESQIALLEYLLGRINDNAFLSGESVVLLTKQAELLYDLIQINKLGLNDALELSLSTSEIISLMAGDTNVLNGKTFTEDLIDAIKEYRDNLLDLNEKFDEIRETIKEKVMEIFDAWGEKLDDGIELLEHYGDVLENYRNIIDIVGEDGLGISDEFMKNLNEALIGNAIDKVNATRDAYEAMMKALQEAEKALEEAKERGDEASIKMWTENLAELTDEANSALEEFLSAWEDALDTVAEQFEMTVERVIESFNESIYALGGLEGLSEEFSRQQETADMMVDDYQKIYELSKLNRDIQKTLDDTDVIAGKQKLLKLQEKINDLEAEGIEMSQYDLEYLQAEYELRMAEIELENAQKAKDTVRMSRDNEGNWSYVYTTNTDAVDEAQLKYEDALYAMQDLSSNYIDEMSEKLISTSQEMEEALASLRIQDFASIDDYYAEVERIKKEYGELLALEQAELQKAIDNNKVLYDEDMTNYAKATGEKYRLAEEFVTSFKDSLLGSIMDSESESANFTDIIGSAVDDLTTGLMEAATTYYQNLEAAMNAADTSTGDFAEDTAANINAVVEKSKEGAEAIDLMAIEMTEAFQEITDMVTNWQETYGMAMEKIIQSNLDVIESFNNMLEALSIDADKINVSYDINTSPEKDNPAAFDTGGYTGKWGDIGKLAVLHEKELILNENDTSNFLKAINISKVILDMIETNAKYASMGLGQITPTVIKEEAKETFEQIVHITADFSGVKDRNEIEEAFKSLINTSSQYANRK